MQTLVSNYLHIKEQVALACQQANREVEDIKIIAVSKGHDSDTIKSLFNIGHTDFGENKLQEAERKIKELDDKDISWHFIGPIQSNKAKRISESFSWVHSVDRIKIAKALSDARPSGMPKLNICIQINIDNEEQKSGIDLVDIDSFLEQLSSLPNIRLRGFMCIPKKDNADKHKLENYKIINDFFCKYKNKYLLDTLSMGMSNDFSLAIASGANMIRIGRAIFNPAGDKK